MRKFLALSLALLFVVCVCGCSQDERVLKLQEQLERIDSDIQTGINASAYSDRLRELSFAVKQVEDNELGTEEMRARALEALDAYKRAGEVWSVKIGLPEESLVYKYPPLIEKKTKLWIPVDGKISKYIDEIALINKLIVLSGKFEGKKYCTVDDVLQAFWSIGREHGEKALNEIR